VTSKSANEVEKIGFIRSKKMVLRKNRQMGEAFYGCSGYPRCRNIAK
jgi:ssDNA-binding Zn-finger/Zn-ribbon topoisomerase 1